MIAICECGGHRSDYKLIKSILYNSTTQFSGQMFVYTFLTCTLWGLVLQFMAGYFFLHSWLNLWGEVLRFADREFYSVS